MIGLNGQPALVPPLKYNTKCQVNLYTDCPLSGFDNIIPIKTCSNVSRILSKCIVLECLCGRLSKLKNTTFGYSQWVVKTSEAYADICKILKTVGASDVRSYLEEHDLTKLFPLLDKFVKNEILPKMSRSPLTSHLSSFSTYGQVNSLCNTMLEELLFGGSHKYVAHQFALLYRALTATGLVLQSYRIKGEGLFITLKQELDQYQILSVDTQEMLIQYLSVLKEESQSLVLSNSISQAFFEATEI
ncbi:hypothetical protein ACHWQZ_G003080 [Mnemiopsis leidyi]